MTGTPTESDDRLDGGTYRGPDPVAADKEVGDHMCGYHGCDADADYRVQVETGTVFYCCQSCSVNNRVYVKENELLEGEVSADV